MTDYVTVTDTLLFQEFSLFPFIHVVYICF